MFLSRDRELVGRDGAVLGLERRQERLVRGRLAEDRSEHDGVLRLDRQDRRRQLQGRLRRQRAEGEQVGGGGGVLEAVGDLEDGVLVGGGLDLGRHHVDQLLVRLLGRRRSGGGSEGGAVLLVVAGEGGGRLQHGRRRHLPALGGGHVGRHRGQLDGLGEGGD